jgi:hypothetical protein
MLVSYMRKYFLSGVLFLFLIINARAQHYLRIDKNLDIFFKLNPKAKISFFFNQPCYMAGDTAYFAARVVNSADLKPIKKRGVLHLILVNEKGQNALDQFFLVEDGVASNQIIIPSTLQPGIYRLLCLRESITDPNKEVLFQQDFEIVGVNKKTVIDTVESISFFPEGGSILDGTENKIFVSVHPAGRFYLKVLDGLDSEAGSFKTNSNGIGFFFLRPKEGQTYYLSGFVDNKSIRAPLPMAKKSGFSLRTNIAAGRLTVTGFALEFTGNPEIILIKNDRVFYAEKLRWNGTNSFSSEISLGETLTGLFQLWITDRNRVLASRILYYNPEYESELLNIRHAFRVHPRNKMEILVEKNDSLMKGDFSVRIFQKSLFPSSTRNIPSNLELFNDWSPQMWPVHADDLRDDSINDFLATLHWQRYSIDSLINGKFKTRRLNFDHPYSIKGKAIGVPDLAAQQRALVTLYFENSNFIEETYLNNNDDFLISLTEPVALEEKVYYRIDVNGTELVGAKLEILKADRILPVIQTRYIKEENPYFSYKTVINSADKSYNYFGNESRPPKLKIEQLKGLEAKSYGADNVYTLKDYLPFSTMKEVIVEILAKATLRKINGKNAVRVYLEDWSTQTSVLAKGDPLFIIDGVPTNNADFFLALKPSNIERIKIIWKVERNVLKSFGNNGVIVVETKESSLSPLVPALNSFKLTGFSSRLPFTMPKKPGDERVPYFKSCLYWDPVLKFDKDGVSKFSFFTPDDLGEFVMEVEGLTADGAPYHHRSSFVIVP